MSDKTSTEPPEIEAFLGTAPASIRPLLKELRGLVRSTLPEAREEIKWGRPVYSLRRIVCYLASAEEHASLGFYRGVELTDPNGLLEGSGKRLRHIKVRRQKDIRRRLFAGLLRQAAELDSD